MKTRVYSISGLILFVVMIGCKETSRRDDRKSTAEAPVEIGPAQIAPSHARIIGEVIHVESSLDPEEVDSPCARVPCVAEIRILAVLGAGAGFTKPLGEGTVVRMKFAYTLQKTVETFPDMEPALPGLAVGTKFKADILGQETMTGDPAPQYVVFAYEVQ